MSQKVLIDGEWVQGESGQFFDVINPATEEVVDQVPLCTRDDAKAALESAAKAQESWEDVPAAQRAKVVWRLADLIEGDLERLARIVTSEEGKPLKEAREDVQGAVEYCRYYAALARQVEGQVLPGEGPERTIMLLKIPVGVVVGITPWNFPAAMVTRKMAPALVAGDSIVLKPSSYTPLSAIEIVKLAQRAGVPKGLVNVVTGSGSMVGDELVRNPVTQMVTMTGSVETGERIMEAASKNLTRLVLELGGKAPFIVWKDADLEWAVKSALWARYWNAGQTCICNERTYVHGSVYDRFKKKFLEAVRGLRVGDPMRQGVDMGPLVAGDQLEKVDESVRKAVEDGAKVLLGGERLSGEGFERGYWYSPTVLEDVDQGMDIVRKEVFGPVTPLADFEDLDEVIQYSNDSEYGLASYVFARDIRVAMRAAHKLKFGETYINQVGPETVHGYHAGLKKSGIGGDGSRYGFDHYFHVKTVYLDYSESPTAPYIFPYP